jgi:hypothetical protein
MRSLSDPVEVERLLARMDGVRADSPRRWGSLTPGEMLWHLADSAASLLDRPGGPRGHRRPIVRWLAFRSPLRWPRCLRPAPLLDSAAPHSRAGDFEAERARAKDGIRALAQAATTAFPRAHATFGTMSAADWRCLAARHTDHHLRQFGA